MSFFIKHDELSKKYNKIWTKSAMVLKNDLTANQSTMKNIQKLK